jgi:hypothetical protein
MYKLEMHTLTYNFINLVYSLYIIIEIAVFFAVVSSNLACSKI